MSKVIRGAGGGGSSSSSGGVEAPDSLRSNQIARYIDAICEGEIVGLVDGNKSIFLNDTPLENADGSQNFGGVQIQIRTGTLTQTAMDGFSDVETETAVGVEVKHATPITRTLTNSAFSSARVTVGVNGLLQYDDSGNINGTSVAYTIEVQSNGGGFQSVVSDTISGKTGSGYRRAHRINLPGSGPWDIRVTKTTADSTSSKLTNALLFLSVTGIIESQIAYINTAVVGVAVNAQQFSQVPTRAYHVKGRIIRVPSNYDPIGRSYSGLWDGAFKQAWTDNPAWCFYDLLTHERYGLGRYITEDTIDKWGLYQIARYCDQLVPDGHGGTEPRFTCNLVLQTREEAFKVLQNMASIFRGIAYWGPAGVVAVQDRPADPVALYTNANVIDGAFAYVGTSLAARHSVALVTWNDPEDMYRQKVEYVQDDDAVRQFGVVQTEVAAFGCNSRGQAVRFGRWLLQTEQIEDETVTFKAGYDAGGLYPGAIIQTSDANRTMVRFGGRVGASTSTHITLDAPVTLQAGTVYQIVLTMPDGTPQMRPISNTGGTVSAVDATTAFDAAPLVDSVYAIVAGAVAPEQWRVVGVTEESDGTISVAAVHYNPSKYDAVELGFKLDALPVSPYSVRPAAPDGLTFVVAARDTGGDIVALAGTLAWSSTQSAFTVRWRFEAEAWHTLDTTETTVDIGNLQVGNYTFTVAAHNALGLVSQPATLLYTVTPQPIALPDVTGLTLEGAYTTDAAKFKWAAVAGATGYEVKIDAGGQTRRTVSVGNALRFDYTSSDMRVDGGPWRSFTFSVRAIGKWGSASAWAAITASNPQLAALQGIKIDGGVKSAFFSCAAPVEDDYAGIIVWVSTDPTCPAVAGNQVYIGRDTFVTVSKLADGTALTGNTIYYLRAAGYDTFGQDNINLSSSIAFSVYDVSQIANDLSESNLAQSLQQRIGLIDAPDSTAGSVAARVKAEADARSAAVLAEADARAAAVLAEAQARGTAVSNETTLRQAGDNQLAQSISMLTAGVAGGFDPGAIWYFDADTQGWWGGNNTGIAWNNGWVDVTAHNGDPMFMSPAVSISGAQYSVVKARIKRLAGSGWDGYIYYATTTHGIDGGFCKQIPTCPVPNVGDTAIVEWDMSQLTAGGSDWVLSTITQIRMDFGNDNAADVFSVDWVAVGRNAPGASMAGLMTEQQARIAADQAEAQERTTLAARVGTAESNITTLNQTVASNQSSTATQISTLQAKVATRPNLMGAPASWSLPGWLALTDNATWGQIIVGACPSGTSTVILPIPSVEEYQTYTASTDMTFQQSGRANIALVFRDANGNLTAAYDSTQIAGVFDFRDTDARQQAMAISGVCPRGTAHGYVHINFRDAAGGGIAGFRRLKVEHGGLPATAYTQETEVKTVGADLYSFRSAQASADSALSQRIDTVSASVSSNAAAIQNESTARASADSALSQQIDTVSASVSSNAAAIQNESTARASADSALSQQASTIQTQVNGNTASIHTQATSINGLEAQYTVKVDVNGMVAGYGLASQPYNGQTVSSFIVNSNLFGIGAPGKTTQYPFVVDTSSGVVGVNGSLVVNGQAIIDKLSAGSISGAKIAAGTASIDVLSSGVGSGNLCTNSAMVETYESNGYTIPDGFTFGYSILSSSNIAIGINTVGDTWHPSGVNCLTVHQSDSAGSGNSSAYVDSYTAAFTVGSGIYYEASVYTAAHRCAVSAYIIFLDSSGGWTGATLIGTNSAEMSGGVDINGYKRLFGVSLAPTGTVQAKILMRKFATFSGQSDSYGFFLRPYCGVANGADQTSPSPWSAPGIGTYINGGILKANTVTADKMSVSSLSAISANMGSISGGSMNIGNGNFIVDSAGNASMNSLTLPGMRASNGVLTINQLDVINTSNIKSNAVSNTFFASTNKTSLTLTININSSGNSNVYILMWHKFDPEETNQIVGLSIDGNTTYGSSTSGVNGSESIPFVVSLSPGNHTLKALSSDGGISLYCVNMKK
ncbi:phage tail protein [Brachymonas sp.]|uniref:TipJ family phage tail tip protein n=1 Tax=Brachymonas sp. TaxID=1936292 RepID=UPI0035B2ECC7